MSRRLPENRKDPRISALSGAIMLIGIVILVVVDSIPFFPWILLVLALAGLPAGVTSAGWWGALPSLWLGALAIFIGLDWTASGVAILVLMAIGLAIINRARRN